MVSVGTAIAIVLFIIFIVAPVIPVNCNTNVCLYKSILDIVITNW